MLTFSELDALHQSNTKATERFSLFTYKIGPWVIQKKSVGRGLGRQSNLSSLILSLEVICRQQSANDVG
jgi:hypothetical protein